MFLTLTGQLLMLIRHTPCQFVTLHKTMYRWYFTICLQSLPTDCDVILTGDFIVPNINWSTFNANSSYYMSICNI